MNTPKGIKLSLSATALKQLIRSPQHFIQYRLEGSADTEALAFGSAWHTWILQRELFFTKYRILDESKRPFPDKNYQTKANKEWKLQFFEQCTKDKITALTKADWETIQQMADAMMATTEAAELITATRSKFEQNVKWKKRGVEFNGFIDIENEHFLADLKSCVNADPKVFARDIFKFRYDLQGACYSDAVSKGARSFGKHLPFYIIAQEKTAPFAVSVHLLGNEVLDAAYEEMINAVDIFKQCIKDDHWPGYAIKAPAMINGVVNDEGVFPVTRPPWI